MSCKKVLFKKETYLVCIMHDITEREKLRRAVESSLAEKVVLLREVHHRVKNNLQLVNSLLNLQESNSSDAPSTTSSPISGLASSQWLSFTNSSTVQRIWVRST
ncbi:MAG: hypothetical protein HC888_16160 [Candidatus Competibacteraceae bacterium]|nr:hypothetical protein [Candidatus Competibacteraceae bacterium]